MASPHASQVIGSGSMLDLEAERVNVPVSDVGLTLF